MWNLWSEESQSLNTIATYIPAMATTTIQVSQTLVEVLKGKKLYEKESYEEVIWDLIEDTQELSAETKRNIAQAEKEVREGKVHSWEDVKKELRIHV